MSSKDLELFATSVIDGVNPSTPMTFEIAWEVVNKGEFLLCVCMVCFVAHGVVCGSGSRQAQKLTILIAYTLLSPLFPSVGGIYTVIKTKVPQSVAALGENYWLVHAHSAR